MFAKTPYLRQNRLISVIYLKFKIKYHKKWSKQTRDTFFLSKLFVILIFLLNNHYLIVILIFLQGYLLFTDDKRMICHLFYFQKLLPQSKKIKAIKQTYFTSLICCCDQKLSLSHYYQSPTKLSVPLYFKLCTSPIIMVNIDSLFKEILYFTMYVYLILKKKEIKHLKNIVIHLFFKITV